MTKNKTILFIDDQLEDWEGFLKTGLKEFGFDILGEEDPSKVLSLIVDQRPDAILLDILFADGETLGKPTLELIKRKYPLMPVIMFTSTMAKSEYRPEDYELADYRYAKAALADGDCSDLAAQLKRIIDAPSVNNNINDITGVGDIEKYGFFVGETFAMQRVAETITKVADQNHTILITGESGTGKNIVAEALHNMSDRRDAPFVTIVCSAVPEDLLESELFGYEKGAFTGAESSKKGKFEFAGSGTIFLDEIGEIPLKTQVKLLRFLQSHEFERVGGNDLIISNAKIIVATNRNLEELIQKGQFREDLYYRMSVVPIHLPPLRERKQDISKFIEIFIAKGNAKSKMKILSILREDVKNLLYSYNWPGNIRELENIVNTAVALSDENILQMKNFPKLLQARSNLPSDFNFDLDSIVDRVFQGDLVWGDLKREFGIKGVLLKQLLNRIIEKWMLENNKRPTYKHLATLLAISDGNVRRILSECNVKLKSFK